MSRLISDATWAALTIWGEARGEPQEGRVAVAEVIRNRTARRYQSDGTVVGTVLHPYAFSLWNTLDKNKLSAALLDTDDLLYRECLAAWQTACEGSQTVRGAVLYLNPSLVRPTPLWASLDYLAATIGNHQFYLDPPT